MGGSLHRVAYCIYRALTSSSCSVLCVRIYRTSLAKDDALRKYDDISDSLLSVGTLLGGGCNTWLSTFPHKFSMLRFSYAKKLMSPSGKASFFTCCTVAFCLSLEYVYHIACSRFRRRKDLSLHSLRPRPTHTHVLVGYNTSGVHRAGQDSGGGPGAKTVDS